MTAAHVAGKVCMVFVTVPSREVAETIAGGELEIDIVYLRPNSDECLEYLIEYKRMGRLKIIINFISPLLFNYYRSSI